MEFTIEFYETSSGRRPVRGFLDKLKDSNPDDFAAVLAGLAKLRNSEYHRPPLSKPIGNDLFELRHVGKLNTRVLYFGPPCTREAGCSRKKRRLAEEEYNMKGRTDFDLYLEVQLKDPAFAARFKKAGQAWEVAMQLAALRKESGLSQKELASRLGTSQQQISRLESPGYEGHSLSMMRRVADELGATVRVSIEKKRRPVKHAVAEKDAEYINRS